MFILPCSQVFLDILTTGGIKEPISLEENASMIHAFLYLIIEHTLDPADEPDPTLDNLTREGSSWTTLALARLSYARAIKPFLEVCHKYQMINHDQVVSFYLLEQLSAWGAYVSEEYFVLATEYDLEIVAKKALEYMGQFGGSDALPVPTGHMSWAQQGIYPWTMRKSSVKRMPIRHYNAYVVACAAAIQKDRDKLKVDWKRASELFKLDSSKVCGGR